MKKLLIILILISNTTFSQDLKESANEHVKKENWESAIKDYKKYLKKNEKDSSAWYALGGTYVKAGQFEKALESYQKAKEKNFSINFISVSSARVYAKMKDETKMLAMLNEAADNGLPIFKRIQDDVDFQAYQESADFKKVVERMKNNAYPCLNGENYRHFDFWLGEWDVYVGEQKVGVNSITMAQGGCAIHENYTTAGAYAGQSINYYDPIDKKWHQHWVGSSGDVYNYLETKREEGLLQFESDFMTPTGQITLSRLTFTLNNDSTVTQLFESSSDDGKTWAAAFNGTYIKIE